MLFARLFMTCLLLISFQVAAEEILLNCSGGYAGVNVNSDHPARDSDMARRSGAILVDLDSGVIKANLKTDLSGGYSEFKLIESNKEFHLALKKTEPKFAVGDEFERMILSADFRFVTIFWSSGHYSQLFGFRCTGGL